MVEMSRISGINFRKNGIKTRYKVSAYGDLYQTKNPSIRAKMNGGRLGIYSGGLPDEIHRVNDELKGRPASYYIGIGRAFVPSRPDISKFPAENIPDDKIETEMEEARAAFNQVKDNYVAVSLGAGPSATTADVADALIRVLDDLAEQTLSSISENKMNFKLALQKFYDKCIEQSKSSNEKIRALVEELLELYNNLILAKHKQTPNLLAGIESVSNLHNNDKVIVVCVTIDPIEATSLTKQPCKVAGVIEEKGGIKSHTTIACESNGTPLVIGVDAATQKIKNGDLVIVDGEKGKVIVHPSPETVKKYMKLMESSATVRATIYDKYKDLSDVGTKDGCKVVVAGNSKSVAEAYRLSKEGVKKIGLLRTEPLYMVDLLSGTVRVREEAPSLQDQVTFYSNFYNEVKGSPAVVRTIDINGDKFLPYIGKPKCDELGQIKEGVGLCLDGTNHKPYYLLFKDQIKAVVIAAILKNVDPVIEFPMVLSLEQFKEAKLAVKAAIHEMREDISTIKSAFNIEKIDEVFEKKIKYYAMVEHPGLIKDIEGLAGEADGLSIGTNDLTMKTLYENRYLSRGKFDELDPKVLQHISSTVKAAIKAGKPVSVCGDMAGDLIAVPILLGLGIRELSVEASSATIVKSMVSNIDIKACERLVEEIKELQTAPAIREHAARFIWTRMYHPKPETNEDWSGLLEIGTILADYFNLADGFQFHPEDIKKDIK